MKPFKAPQRTKLLDGHEDWLRERFTRHRGNADVVRQDLIAEKGLAVSRRTLQRAVQAYRQVLKAEALATTRFETPPGRQLQIDFGERLVEISGVRVKAFVFVATLGRVGCTYGPSETSSRRAGSSGVVSFCDQCLSAPQGRQTECQRQL